MSYLDVLTAEVGESAEENGFHDLSSRTQIFRNKLIEEFQLLDNLASSNSSNNPVLDSSDFQNATTRENILRHTPQQLIKFKAFKRSQQTETITKDRRLTRTRNINTLPLDAFCYSVTNHKYYQNFIFYLILINTVFIGIDAELSPEQYKYWGLFQFIRIIDLFIVFIFVLDVVLKWIDDFGNFWKDWWNVIDFVITIMTILPEILELVDTDLSIQKFGSQLRSFRILRTLKVIVNFGNFRIVVLTIIQALQAMAYIMLLVLLVAFIYGILGVNLYFGYVNSDIPDLKYQFYFNDIGTALMALFQILTKDHWDDINRDLARVADPVWSYLYIISWIFLGGFIFRNIFIGVMVNNFDKIAVSVEEQKKEKDKMLKFEKMRKKLNKQLQAAQTNIKHSINNLDKKPEVETDNNMSSSIDDLILSIQKLLVESQVNSKEWEATVAETMHALQGKQSEVYWPKDTLFVYLQTMESLQENMAEYQSLQTLAALTLLDLHDS